MSNLSLRLPNSLHDAVKSLAKEEDVSINQLITLALAEKLSALKTDEYLLMRSQRGSKSKYQKALKQVPDVEPDEVDKL